MLTISLDRLIDLLDKAAEVEIPETAVPEDGIDAKAATLGDALEAMLADDPAFGQLVEAVGRLTPDETGEVLALALLARNAASLDEWQAMVEQARTIPDETIADELLRTLLLTDELETALEQLGYLAEDDEEDAEDEEDEEDEEEGEEAPE